MLATVMPYPIRENYAPSTPLWQATSGATFCLFPHACSLCLPLIQTTCLTFCWSYGEDSCRTRPAFRHDLNGLWHLQKWDTRLFVTGLFSCIPAERLVGSTTPFAALRFLVIPRLRATFPLELVYSLELVVNVPQIAGGRCRLSDIRLEYFYRLLIFIVAQL